MTGNLPEGFERPHYWPEEIYPGFIDPEAPTSAPEPGTGTVWVIPPEADLSAVADPGPSTSRQLRLGRREAGEE